VFVLNSQVTLTGAFSSRMFWEGMGNLHSGLRPDNRAAEFQTAERYHKAMAQSPDNKYLELARHEDMLINHRLTWLLAGQPFLLMAYATMVSVPRRSLVPDQSVAAEHYERALHVVPVIGIVLAFGVFLGVLGAVRALFLLKKHRGPEHTGEVSTHTTLLGLATPMLLPWLFVWAWCRIGF
jgi:hypothetical protein